MGNSDPSTSAYDAINLLDSMEDNGRNNTSMTSSRGGRTDESPSPGRYTIDSDEEDGESSTEESSDDNDDYLSEDDDDDDSKGSDAANSTAVTEVHRNLLNSPPVQRRSTTPSSPDANKSAKRSMIPPASSFKNIGRRLPSYMIKGSNQKSDNRGRHERISTSDDDDILVDDEENNRKKTLMRDPINSVRDPSQFPLEEYTDAEYGIRSTTNYENYSYATSDPSSVNYEPKALSKMEYDEDKQMVKDLEERKRKLVFWGFLGAISVCVIIILIALISHANSRRQHIMKAPANLEDMCDITNISIEKGFLECEKACVEAECCMAPGNLSCFKDQQETCKMYSPCATLYTSRQTVDEYHAMVPPPPSNLDKLCSSTSISVQSTHAECIAVCEGGSCCFASGSLNSLDNTFLPSCSNTHPDVCAAYSGCGPIKDPTAQHTNPIDIVKSKCTTENIKLDKGRDACETACQPRSCCFTDSTKRNCYEDNKVWCDDFYACNVLTGEDIEMNPPDGTGGGNKDEPNGIKNDPMADMCSKDARELSIMELSDCRKKCDPATCCFYDDIGCTRSIDCDFYKFCEGILDSETPGLDPEDEVIEEIMPPSGGQHTPGPPPIDVAEACSDDRLNLYPIKQTTCYHMCSNYLCCFEEDYDPLSCHEESTCSKYTPCMKAIQIDDKDKDLCSIENILLPNGLEKCKGRCVDHECCFQSKDNDKCEEDHCSQSEFKSCKILAQSALEGSNLSGAALFNFNKACSPNALTSLFEREICTDICGPHKCCFDPDDSCGEVQNDTFCYEYKACENLLTIEDDEYYYEDEDYYYEDEDEDANDTANHQASLKSICDFHLVKSDDDFFVNNCIDQCKAAQCCYDGTCDYKTSFCATRTACSAVNSPRLACAGNMLTDSAKRACTNACSVFSCCWTEGINCSGLHENACIDAVNECASIKF